jgi:hypothetical protein
MGKPKEWQAFDTLAKQLVKVPKDKVDAKIAATKKRRVKKKK